jgi:hypothetical protein
MAAANPPPLPPPIAIIDELKDEFAPLESMAPPAPTVTGYDVPVANINAPERTPPPPPPPPLLTVTT